MFKAWGFVTPRDALLRAIDVAGFVRNLRDGRVHVAVEGRPAEIDAFLAELQTGMQGYIADVQEMKVAPTGDLSGFEIRF